MNSHRKTCPNCSKIFHCSHSCSNSSRKGDQQGCFCVPCLKGPERSIETKKEFDKYVADREGCSLLSKRFWKNWETYLTSYWVFTKCT